MSTETETRRVVEDRYPATVRRPDGQLITEPCRVILTRDEIYVWSQYAGQVVAEHRGPWTENGSEIVRRRTWRVQDGAGGHWTVERRTGCRCGALARFVPWVPFLPGRR